MARQTWRRPILLLQLQPPLGGGMIEKIKSNVSCYRATCDYCETNTLFIAYSENDLFNQMRQEGWVIEEGKHFHDKHCGADYWEELI